ncbi:hypothetical protein C806_02743 [Lachnospiraceae bacterium 3-1]|nr:hypothetical protein C806_02743 [Lachnospiraceae bacterium 3-1]
MEEKIQALFYKLRRIGISFLIYQERNITEQVKKIIPEIQEFVLWFLEGNRFGIEEELYQDMSSNLLHILEDILEALKQNDTVLLYDATANGLLDYLQLFVELEQEEEADDDL